MRNCDRIILLKDISIDESKFTNTLYYP
nr:ribosomal protein L22 [[Bauhinia] glauca var. hupehana]WPN87539.1 ribosomal protein L22 [[Bauhinia] glauca var. hupehana]